MEAHEIEILERYVAEDAELKGLWDEHILFKKQIDKLESKPFLTPTEQKTVKELKKQKLEGKTRLLSLLDRYKVTEG